MSNKGQMVSTFQERFSDLIDERPESDAELAKKLMVSKQTVSAWRTGVRSPKITTAATIARIFNVNLDWLVGYDVKKEASGYFLPDGITPVSKMPRYKVPLIGSVAAGEPVYDEEFYDVYVDSPSKVDYALRVKGDSMEPTYLDGDIVYVRTMPSVPESTIAVVLIDDEVCVKHVYYIPNGVLLVSDNPKYPPKSYTWPEHENIRVLGVVVGFTRMYKV